MKFNSGYYFDKPGKLIRPAIVNLISSNISGVSKVNRNVRFELNQEISYKTDLWSKLMEILHVTSLVHDDIIDESPNRRGRETLYKKIGPEKTQPAAIFLIARWFIQNKFSSRYLYQMEGMEYFRIFNKIMGNLAQV